MGRRAALARRILRHLRRDITFTPQSHGVVKFVGHASIGPLIAETVLAQGW
jgi:hypothetical protein